VRGSFARITRSPAPAGSANVASTTTIGRVPLASNPIFACTDVGASGLPSNAIASAAIAYAVSVSRSASIACALGWLAARAMIRSVGSPVPAA
jgi:hypothetical protein